MLSNLLVLRGPTSKQIILVIVDTTHDSIKDASVPAITADLIYRIGDSETTGWSINNRTILNCSHFLARRYLSNPFSPKWSIHTGKLSQQHEFVMTSFVILVW